MLKAQFSKLLRQLGLLMIVDRLRFSAMQLKNRSRNAAFKRNHPEVPLPPDYLIYESFQIDYEQYYTGSIQSAKNIVDRIGNHIELKGVNILDWGCGPGRIIRQLPGLVGEGCQFYGTDYNKESIDWCTENLPGIHFNNNSLEAKLPYPDGFFDVIYGISIFTHLSEKMHHDWYAELSRVLKPNGVMYLTTQGDNFKSKLTHEELGLFNQGKLVVRGNVKEGHRVFSAFQPKTFMHQFFSNARVLEHIETPVSGSWIPQDAWIIQKTAGISDSK
ncbi:class I SAM-dependent methyltransferase [Flavobacterium sp.]|uniref:class I SAM-dependent methyltransferase n=1 Tax=Flavobacterium sp. TaxID=239 RepID=UPI002619FA0F|nr:class I SAM-dependent methyltransferase [Flavobacterium sp.]